MEAAEEGIKLVVCITEGILVKDMIMVKEYLRDKKTRLIGLIARVLLLQEK